MLNENLIREQVRDLIKKQIIYFNLMFVCMRAIAVPAIQRLCPSHTTGNILPVTLKDMHQPEQYTVTQMDHRVPRHMRVVLRPHRIIRHPKIHPCMRKQLRPPV